MTIADMIPMLIIFFVAFMFFMAMIWIAIGGLDPKPAKKPKRRFTRVGRFELRHQIIMTSLQLDQETILKSNSSVELDEISQRLNSDYYEKHAEGMIKALEVHKEIDIPIMKEQVRAAEVAT